MLPSACYMALLVALLWLRCRACCAVHTGPAALLQPLAASDVTSACICTARPVTLLRPGPVLRLAGSTHDGDSAHRCWGRQQYLAGSVMQMRYSVQSLTEVLGLVQKANLALNLTDPENKCPYMPEYCAGLPYKTTHPPPNPQEAH